MRPLGLPSNWSRCAALRVTPLGGGVLLWRKKKEWGAWARYSVHSSPPRSCQLSQYRQLITRGCPWKIPETATTAPSGKPAVGLDQDPFCATCAPFPQDVDPPAVHQRSRPLPAALSWQCCGSQPLSLVRPCLRRSPPAKPFRRPFCQRPPALRQGPRTFARLLRIHPLRRRL